MPSYAQISVKLLQQSRLAGLYAVSEHDGIQERRGGRDGVGAKLADLENTCSVADLKHGLQ